MNSVNRNTNNTPQPRLIILERYAANGDKHAERVAKNARIVNPNVQITKVNERSAYYRSSTDKGLKHLIQNNLRGHLKGFYESLQAIADDKNVKNTVVNFSQSWNQMKELDYLFFNNNTKTVIDMMTQEEKKRLVSSNAKQILNLSNLETFIDDAWNGIKNEIKSWQAKIKNVVAELKNKNVAVVQSAGNDAGNGESPGLNSPEYSEIKHQFAKYEAIDPMLQGTGIIGVGSTKQNGDLEHYSTRGNHYQFATTVPDGADGTSFTAPAIATGVSVLVAKGFTVHQALDYLRKIGTPKKDDQGNPYTYISLEKLQKLKDLPSLKKVS
jgi:hypothetical protein